MAPRDRSASDQGLVKCVLLASATSWRGPQVRAATSFGSPGDGAVRLSDRNSVRGGESSDGEAASIVERPPAEWLTGAARVSLGARSTSALHTGPILEHCLGEWNSVPVSGTVRSAA